MSHLRKRPHGRTVTMSRREFGELLVMSKAAQKMAEDTNRPFVDESGTAVIAKPGRVLRAQTIKVRWVP